VNKYSEVKYGVFRVEVKVWKEQTVGCTGVRHGQWDLLNRGAGFEPMTSTAGKRRYITNVAGDLPLYHHRCSLRKLLSHCSPSESVL